MKIERVGRIAKGLSGMVYGTSGIFVTVMTCVHSYSMEYILDIDLKENEDISK